MRARLVLLKLLLATFVAVAAAHFSIGSLNVSGIYPTSWTDADLIRHRCPVRLIQPDWVNDHADLLMNWLVAEMKARLGLITVFWLAGICVILAQSAKNRPDTHAA